MTLTAKSRLKKIIPTEVWEILRQGYSRIRRFYLDIWYTMNIRQPVEWVRIFFLIRKIRPTYSMVPPPRLRLLYELSKRINKEKVIGDIVECGVYNGGSAAMMSSAQSFDRKSVRHLWLFDSFEGLPSPTENDGLYERTHYYKGWCGGSVEKVHEIFRILDLSREYLHIIKGLFQETFTQENTKIVNIALLHIDADWYESVKICLETFYPKVSHGGYVVFDDYNTFSGCKKAVHEYFDKHNLKVKLETRDGVGVYFKKP